jgi:hypothetical protein
LRRISERISSGDFEGFFQRSNNDMAGVLKNSGKPIKIYMSHMAANRAVDAF